MITFICFYTICYLKFSGYQVNIIQTFLDKNVWTPVITVALGKSSACKNMDLEGQILTFKVCAPSPTQILKMSLLPLGYHWLHKQVLPKWFKNRQNVRISMRFHMDGKLKHSVLTLSLKLRLQATSKSQTSLVETQERISSSSLCSDTFFFSREAEWLLSTRNVLNIRCSKSCCSLQFISDCFEFLQGYPLLHSQNSWKIESSA